MKNIDYVGKFKVAGLLSLLVIIGTVVLFFTNIFILVVFSISVRTVFTRLVFVNTLLLFFLAAVPCSWFFLKNNLYHTNYIVHNVPFSDYFNSISQKTKNAFNISAKARILPNNFLKEIGNSSVDILPWEQTFLIYNNLNYCPRPVFQTYQAYTPILDGLNSSFYNSAKSPQYLLFSNHTTDTRNPFWEETKTKLSIYENYSLIDSMTCDTSIHSEFYTAETPPKILLLKRDEKKSKNLNLVKSEKFNLLDDAVIDIPLDDKIILLKINISQSLVGKIRGAIFQPAVMEARLMINNVWTKKYRVSPSLFAEGVIINKAVLNTTDASNFFADKLNLISNVQKIQFMYPEVSKYYSMPVDYSLNYYTLKRNYLGEL